jgi:uncharacterized damage-inducible protein DinB
MAVKDMLRDLYLHQAWADAELWRALEAQPRALEDPAIRERLHHIHLVQRAFLSIVQGEAPVLSKIEDFPSMAALKEHAREYHERVAALLDGVSAARLADEITIPWFKDPPIVITIGQALTQAAMHSHYHRGQNATRLRELGGRPPLTDLIVWYWKGRPRPAWD